MDQINNGTINDTDSSGIRKQTSMGTLIMWNITKAVEANPNIDLKSAIKATQERLDKDASNTTASLRPEEQYLVYALLAWQQLGYTKADSLYQFVETKRKEFLDKKSCVKSKKQAIKPPLSPGSFISYEDSKLSKGTGSCSYDAYSLVGPVVKLPTEPKIVMRVDSAPARPARKKPTGDELKSKIDAACSMDSACMEKLKQLDQETSELKRRAQQLAQREGERAELLERAEAAWKDLENGFQRRLATAEDKEEELAKHIKRMIEERNDYKNVCVSLAMQLRERGDAAEKERARLTAVEKELCGKACTRLHLSEESAKLDAALSAQHCKAAQMDRDYQFKEVQIRRKLQTMESEAHSMRALTCEAERAVHAELGAIRHQVNAVSQQLLQEDEEITQIKGQLDSLRGEKLEMVEDLDGCKVLCDGKIQTIVDDLKKKREQLNELKETVMECTCKLPVDVSVEVKRTPSLAALCKCTPEDKFLESCSCSSLRTTLLTNLLSDLFGGLQSEMGGSTAPMPCQLLKCLEDKHNWDRSSVLKTNLRSYFSKLLVGELDIAIATSIEKYHARWVGASCADAARMIPDRGGPEAAGWQERAIERRAQKLACKLAEQLFKERADQLTAKAREIVRTGPPPCDCPPRPAAVYPCLVKPPTINSGKAPSTISGAASPAYWRRTHQDVAHLKLQLENLKKDSIKKEDLKIMEENIVKSVQRTAITENVSVEPAKKKQKNEVSRKGNSVHRSVNPDQALKHCVSNKLSSIKKKQSELSPKKTNKNFLLGLQIEKPTKSYKKIGRSYAVNFCVCGSQQDSQNLKREADIQKLGNKEIVPQTSSLKQTKTSVSQVPSLDVSTGKRNKISTHLPCPSDCICFHKPPSNTSIDKLLETLAKWQYDICNLDSKHNTGCQKTHDANTDIIEGEYKETMTDGSNIIKSRNKIYKNASTKISKEPSTLRKSRIIVANMSKNTELQGEMPANSESEYMGAINLDKSNDNVCRCIAGIRNSQEQNNEPNAAVFKCINSQACSCRKTEIKNVEQDKFIESDLVIKKTNEKIIENIRRCENNVQTENEPKPDINGVVKTSTLFPNDNEYCIKFLGVTLTNAISNKVLDEKDKKTKNTNPSKSNKEGNKHLETWYRNVDTTPKNKPHIWLPACDCSVQHGEVKELSNNVCTKQHGDFYKNEDKSLDTHSLKNNTNQETCVCCNTIIIDESKDLELNAFDLLEEHLREKFDEYKLTNYVPPGEEENIFSTIIQRVKKIITESTGVVTCRCAPEESAGGSWHRAYMLLQEYLKLKIKRVQCLCLSTEDDKEPVLPDVMEKVYNLIDNDFQKIKEIWQSQNNFNSTRYSNYIDLPEKDDCHTHENETNTSIQFQSIENICKEVSNTSLIVTQNLSSQITPNIEMATKSCDIMDISNQDAHSPKYCTHAHDNHCYYINSTSLSSSHVEYFSPKEVFANQCIQSVKDGNTFPTNVKPVEASDLFFQHAQQISKPVLPLDPHIKPDLRQSTPYIGFTVDCSCGGVLGTCTCTKSMISGKNDNINSIWNTLTSNKLRFNDVSYIMNAVPNKGLLTEVKDLKTINNVTSPQEVNIITCDTKVSAQYSEELILKDSKDNIDKIFLSTSSENAPVVNSEEPIELIQCNSSIKQKTIKIVDPSDITCDDSLYYPVSNLMNRGANEDFVKSHQIGSLTSNCDCNVVPMCHVKMLMENIENKLIHSKCTCDSLCSKICPVHSKKL